MSWNLIESVSRMVNTSCVYNANEIDFFAFALLHFTLVSELAGLFLFTFSHAENESLYDK